MLPRKPLRISTDLDVIPFASSKPKDDLDWLVCVACRLGLNIDQPDQQSPCRLLGTCEGCGRWYLILLKPDLTSVLMVALPESELFGTVWDEHGGPDGKGEATGTDGSPPGGGSRGLFQVDAP